LYEEPVALIGHDGFCEGQRQNLTNNINKYMYK